MKQFIHRLCLLMVGVEYEADDRPAWNLPLAVLAFLSAGACFLVAALIGRSISGDVGAQIGMLIAVVILAVLHVVFSW